MPLSGAFLSQAHPRFGCQLGSPSRPSYRPRWARGPQLMQGGRDASREAAGAVPSHHHTRDHHTRDHQARDHHTRDHHTRDHHTRDHATRDALPIVAAADLRASPKHAASPRPAKVAPGARTPQAGRPHTGSPQVGSPQVGSPQAGRPHTGSPQAGSPQVGSPQAGSPQAGRPHTGRPQAGSPQVGSPHGGGIPCVGSEGLWDAADSVRIPRIPCPLGPDPGEAPARPFRQVPLRPARASHPAGHPAGRELHAVGLLPGQAYCRALGTAYSGDGIRAGIGSRGGQSHLSYRRHRPASSGGYLTACSIASHLAPVPPGSTPTPGRTPVPAPCATPYASVMDDLLYLHLERPYSAQGALVVREPPPRMLSAAPRCAVYQSRASPAPPSPSPPSMQQRHRPSGTRPSGTRPSGTRPSGTRPAAHLVRVQDLDSIASCCDSLRPTWSGVWVQSCASGRGV